MEGFLLYQVIGLLLYGSVAGLVIYIAFRFLKAQERMANSMEEIADKLNLSSSS